MTETYTQWCPATNRLQPFAAGHRARVTRIVFDPQQRRALSSAYAPQGKVDENLDGLMILWDAERGEVIRRFVGHRAIVRDVAISRDGRRALSGSDDRSVRLWDIASEITQT